MATLVLSKEDLGRLLFKAAHEPRRYAKRFLKDHGGDGSAEELDSLLGAAADDPQARAVAERLERERAAPEGGLEFSIDGRMAEMIAHLLIMMRDQQLTQQELADRCGFSQPQVAAYLNGKKEPGIRNLAKLAAAVGCVWRLLPAEQA